MSSKVKFGESTNVFIPETHSELPKISPELRRYNAHEIAKALDSSLESAETLKDTGAPIWQSTPNEPHLSDINLLKNKQAIGSHIEIGSDSEIDETPSKIKIQKERALQETRINNGLAELQDLRKLKEYLLNQSNGKDLLEMILNAPTIDNISYKIVKIEDEISQNEKYNKDLELKSEELKQKYEKIVSINETEIIKLNLQNKKISTKLNDITKEIKKKDLIISELNSNYNVQLQKQSELDLIIIDLKKQLIEKIDTIQNLCNEKSNEKFKVFEFELKEEISHLKSIINNLKLESENLKDNYIIEILDLKKKLKQQLEENNIQLEKLESNNLKIKKLNEKILEFETVKGIESERLTELNIEKFGDCYFTLELFKVDSLNLIEAQNIIKLMLAHFHVPFKTMKEDFIQIAKEKIFNRIFIGFFKKIHHLICLNDPVIINYNTDDFNHLKTCADSLYQTVVKYHEQR